MDGKVIIRSGKGDYNMGKIINILPMANREDNLQEIMETLQEVKDALVEVLDQYEEEGAEEKADTLTEALDADEVTFIYSQKAVV